MIVVISYIYIYIHVYIYMYVRVFVLCLTLLLELYYVDGILGHPNQKSGYGMQKPTGSWCVHTMCVYA